MNTVLATYRSADLVFDVDSHTYTLPTGQRIPGVTEILSATGLSTDFDELGAMSSSIQSAIDAKRDLGHVLHQDAHALDDNDLDWSTVDPRVEPYLRAWQTFRETYGLTPTTRERRVYHSGLGYAGTLDGIFRLPIGRLVLIDLKCGHPDDAGAAYQLAAYQAAYGCEHDDPITERWAVQLLPGQRVPYKVFPYLDWRDFGVFQAALTVFHHQRGRAR